MDFDGRCALVTGAGSGIGRSTALRLAREGASVLALDLDLDTARATAEAVRGAGGTCRALAADVTKADEVAAAVAEGTAALGDADILVNSAGGGWRRKADFKDLAEDDWQWIIDLNINGVLHCTHAVLPRMVERQYGRIVNLSSIAGHVGIPRLAVYSMTKGAILSLTKALAMELGPHNVTVNSVSPGLVATASPPEATDGTFLGRKGSPDEVAGVIAFLASDEAAYVTGADYLVDGGRVLGPRGA